LSVSKWRRNPVFSRSTFMSSISDAMDKSLASSTLMQSAEPGNDVGVAARHAVPHDPTSSRGSATKWL
jgi:hypothetical protein